MSTTWVSGKTAECLTQLLLFSAEDGTGGLMATASASPPAHLPGIHSKRKVERDHLPHLPVSKKKIPEGVMVL